MSDNSVGNLVIVCKKYTETAEKVRWNSTGETALQSGKRVSVSGRENGVSFHKNDPVTLHVATAVKVKKVEGPKSVVNGNMYEFSATEFSEKVSDTHLRLVRWAYSFDDGKTIVPFKTGTTRVKDGVAYKMITIDANTVDKEVSVYAFFRKPDKKVVAAANIYYLPMVVDVYRVPGLNEAGTDIANDMAYGKGKTNGRVYATADVDAYKKSFLNDGFDNKQDAKYANQSGNGSFKAVYTEKQILDSGYLMQFSNWASDNDSLFYDFRYMVSLMARGELNDNIYAMIDKFEANTGGVYENAKLTAAVQASDSTKQFCKNIEHEIAERIKKGGGDLSKVEDRKIYQGNEDGYRKSHPYGHPSFTYKKEWNLLKGLTIAINDVWCYKVTLLSYKEKGDTYKAKYEIQLWDHFGLDLPDMEKFYSYGAGFRAWFLLQHHRGYKPFLTKMVFTNEFSGNVHEGRMERQS